MDEAQYEAVRRETEAVLNRGAGIGSAHREQDRNGKRHALTNYQDVFSGGVEAPEFVVDDVLSAGAVVLAGERGLGKTSVLVPLSMSCTGLLSDYPLKASIQRKVVYIAEDVGQVRRIIHSMCSSGLLEADHDTINDWFRVVPATRLPAQKIAAVAPEYEDLYTNNLRIDGTTYCAPPLVVLDTTNATIDLENISDNSHVSKAVSALREGFGDINLLMVGHVAKASRSDARQLSFIGAGAWEGDTQQTLYLVHEDNERYLVMGKTRFEAEFREFRVNSHGGSFDAVDKLGRTVSIPTYYGIPEPLTSEAKAKQKAERQAEAKQASWAAMKQAVFDYVRKNEGATTKDVREGVTGKASRISEALVELTELGKVRVEKGEKGAKRHYPVLGQAGTSREWPA